MIEVPAKIKLEPIIAEKTFEISIGSDVAVDAADSKMAITAAGPGSTETLNYLGPYKGKQFAFPVNDVDANNLLAAGFTEVTTPENSKNVRVSTWQDFKDIKLPQAPKVKNYTILTNQENKELLLDKSVQEDIKELMKNSKFSEAKIAEYLRKLSKGLLEVWNETSLCFLIRNEKNKIIGFCHTEQFGGYGYVFDTLIDDSPETGFATKAEGTAIIYQAMGVKLVQQNPHQKVLLIAPPDRAKEFEQDYKCRLPKKELGERIFLRFGMPDPNNNLLEKLFDEQGKKIKEALALSSKQKEIPNPPASQLGASLSSTISGQSTTGPAELRYQLQNEPPEPQFKPKPSMI